MAQLSPLIAYPSGVRQGRSILSHLFKYVMDDILSSTMNGSADLSAELLPGDRLGDLVCTDDTAIYGDSVQAVQHILSRLEVEAFYYDM